MTEQNKMITLSTTTLKQALRTHQKFDTSMPIRGAMTDIMACTCGWRTTEPSTLADMFTAWIEHWIDSLPATTGGIAEAAEAAAVVVIRSFLENVQWQGKTGFNLRERDMERGATDALDALLRRTAEPHVILRGQGKAMPYPVEED